MNTTTKSVLLTILLVSVLTGLVIAVKWLEAVTKLALLDALCFSLLGLVTGLWVGYRIFRKHTLRIPIAIAHADGED